MAEYTIPKPQRRPLDKLRTISDSTFQDLVIAWEQSPASVPSIDGLSASDIEGLKEAVLELYRVRDFFGEKISKFAADISVALQKDSGFADSELPEFGARLAKMLAIPPLGVVAKAASLSTEFERRFCTARILTDARPVFVESASSLPEAMMVTHTLRVTFHDDTGAMREVYVTMDDDDLDILRGLVDRAGEKSKSLRSLFAIAKVQVVEF